MKGMVKKAYIYGYTKFVLPDIFATKLPAIFRRHSKLTPEDMV